LIHPLEVLEQLHELAPHRCLATVRAGRPGDEDHVTSRRPRYVAGGLPQESLGPVTRDRSTDPTRRDDGNPRRILILAIEHVDDQEPSRPLPPSTEHGRDVAAVPQVVGDGGVHRLTQTAWHDRGDGGP
jgi:hypothetical protein